MDTYSAMPRPRGATRKSPAIALVLLASVAAALYFGRTLFDKDTLRPYLGERLTTALSVDERGDADEQPGSPDEGADDEGDDAQDALADATDALEGDDESPASDDEPAALMGEGESGEHATGSPGTPHGDARGAAEPRHGAGPVAGTEAPGAAHNGRSRAGARRGGTRRARPKAHARTRGGRRKAGRRASPARRERAAHATGKRDRQARLAKRARRSPKRAKRGRGAQARRATRHQRARQRLARTPRTASRRAKPAVVSGRPRRAPRGSRRQMRTGASARYAKNARDQRQLAVDARGTPSLPSLGAPIDWDAVQSPQAKPPAWADAPGRGQDNPNWAYLRNTSYSPVKEPALAEGHVSGRWQCSGDVPKAQIQRVVDRAQGVIRQCYERELKGNNLLQGSLKLDVRIGASGRVSATRLSGTMPNKEVRSCVARAAQRWSFPAPTGGSCAVFIAPYSFKPKPSEKFEVKLKR